MRRTERILFIVGLVLTAAASAGLCAQAYAWRSRCGAGGPAPRPAVHSLFTAEC